MSIRESLKKLHRESTIGGVILQPVIWLRDLYRFYLLPEEIYLKQRFKEVFGRNLDLDNPETLNEKIQWLKLNDRSPLHTVCADKYAVREYVKSKIGDKYLVPLIMHTSDVARIRPSNLPDYPVIIKTNHESGTYFIVRDKDDPARDWENIRKKLKASLRRNYYRKSKEWQYKHIKPRIVVEKLLSDRDGAIPPDYKVHVMNQNVVMINIDLGRGTSSHARNWYDTDWRRVPFRWSSFYGNRFTDPVDVDVRPPARLEEMIELSCTLASEFLYVRTDWYEVDGKLYFGEMTFHHDSGFAPILPSEWDKKLGEKLKLPLGKNRT